LRNESINTLKSLEILEASKYSYKSIWIVGRNKHVHGYEAIATAVAFSRVARSAEDQGWRSLHSLY
jgi:hypothetical protein